MKVAAQDVYRVGQQFEHEWREIVRNRAMEETRAANGHYITQAAAPPTSPAASSPHERMRVLKEMLDDGLISAEEFAAKKRDVLSGI